MPWALDMALRCTSNKGEVERFPRQGGYYDQDTFEILLMRTAWRVWAHLNIKEVRTWPDVPDLVRMLQD